MRSLLASMEERERNGLSANPQTLNTKDAFYKRNEEKPSILVPQMSPIHFQFISTAAKMSGYNVFVLPAVDKSS